ncbi:hypothetical protein FHG87_015571 [Trinorchestia longiramus]|nr:hypothetical protein FHG87_015571 [Trinorchestia longiramus]
MKVWRRCSVLRVTGSWLMWTVVVQVSGGGGGGADVQLYHFIPYGTDYEGPRKVDRYGPPLSPVDNGSTGTESVKVPPSDWHVESFVREDVFPLPRSGNKEKSTSDQNEKSSPMGIFPISDEGLDPKMLIPERIVDGNKDLSEDGGLGSAEKYFSGGKNKNQGKKGHSREVNNGTLLLYFVLPAEFSVSWDEASAACEQFPMGMLAKVSGDEAPVLRQYLDTLGNSQPVWIASKQSIVNAIESEREFVRTSWPVQSQSSTATPRAAFQFAAASRDPENLQPEFLGVPEYGLTLHCSALDPSEGIVLRLCDDHTVTAALCVQRVSGDLPSTFNCPFKTNDSWLLTKKWTEVPQELLMKKEFEKVPLETQAGKHDGPQETVQREGQQDEFQDYWPKLRNRLPENSMDMKNDAYVSDLYQQFNPEITSSTLYENSARSSKESVPTHRNLNKVVIKLDKSNLNENEYRIREEDVKEIDQKEVGTLKPTTHEVLTSMERCFGSSGWRKDVCTESGWLQIKFCQSKHVFETSEEVDERDDDGSHKPRSKTPVLGNDFDSDGERNQDKVMAGKTGVQASRSEALRNPKNSRVVQGMLAGGAAMPGYSRASSPDQIRKKRQLDDIDLISSIMFEDLKPKKKIPRNKNRAKNKHPIETIPENNSGTRTVSGGLNVIEEAKNSDGIETYSGRPILNPTRNYEHVVSSVPKGNVRNSSSPGVPSSSTDSNVTGFSSDVVTVSTATTEKVVMHPVTPTIFQFPMILLSKSAPSENFTSHEKGNTDDDRNVILETENLLNSTNEESGDRISNNGGNSILTKVTSTVGKAVVSEQQGLMKHQNSSGSTAREDNMMDDGASDEQMTSGVNETSTNFQGMSGETNEKNNDADDSVKDSMSSSIDDVEESVGKVVDQFKEKQEIDDKLTDENSSANKTTNEGVNKIKMEQTEFSSADDFLRNTGRDIEKNVEENARTYGSETKDPIKATKEDTENKIEASETLLEETKSFLKNVTGKTVGEIMEVDEQILEDGNSKRADVEVPYNIEETQNKMADARNGDHGTVWEKNENKGGNNWNDSLSDSLDMINGNVKDKEEDVTISVNGVNEKQDAMTKDEENLTNGMTVMEDEVKKLKDKIPVHMSATQDEIDSTDESMNNVMDEHDINFEDKGITDIMSETGAEASLKFPGASAETEEQENDNGDFTSGSPAPHTSSTSNSGENGGKRAFISFILREVFG